MRTRGNALIETIVTLFALSPFVTGMVLLGKQLDVKHKTYDALRYSVWERTIWNSKSASDITLETLDRSFGHPHAGVLSPDALRANGVSQNPLWSDRGRRLLMQSPRTDQSDAAPPAQAGYALVPALAHGGGPHSGVASSLRLHDLQLNARAFATTRLTTNLRSALADQPITHIAEGAILSDVWSSRDENDFRRKVDNLTADELVETLEMPARPLAMQSLSKGGPLYGEGQYSWDPDLRPRSNALPGAYIDDRED